MLGNLAPILGMAFVLGLRHATDPDHVIAVTTITARGPSLRRAGAIGALWGIGHTLTILVIGAAIILARVVVPARVGLSLEFGVALMLVALGILNLAGSRRGAAPARTMPPLAVGVVHGLAGSAGATLFVVALIPDPRWAVGALGVFCLGTVAGMSAMTVAIAAPAAYASRRAVGVQRYSRVAAGLVSIAFGLYHAHRVGVVHGLFTDTPRWTPG